MQVAHEIALAVAGHAVTQDVIVHPPADIQRIDLDVAVMGERRADVGVRRVEPERAAQEAAGGERGDVKRGKHSELALSGHLPKKQGAERLRARFSNDSRR